MPSAGDSLGGRYRLADRIAAGGMGEVWQAVDTVLDRPVAVKVLLAGVSAQITFQRRFAHEARAMAALRHPGVAAVYDYGTTDEGAYLVMARIDGQSLERRLATGGRLSPAETMTIVAQAARALHAAHQAGIVHRDVTPGNLIIEPDGNVVLVDFGVARSSASETLTGARNVIGTASYMAPEQVSKREFGPAVDLYALGAVAFHCLTGEPPFTGDDPVAIALRHVTERPPPLPAGVPPKVRALVGRCLAKDPAARHPSGAALAAAASAAGGGDSTLLASEAATIPLPSLPAPGPGTTRFGRLARFARKDDQKAGAGADGLPREAAGSEDAGGEVTGRADTKPGETGRDIWGVVLATMASLLIGAGTAIAVADPYGWFSGPRSPAAPPVSGTPGLSASPPPAVTATTRHDPPRRTTSPRTPAVIPEPPDDEPSENEPSNTGPSNDGPSDGEPSDAGPSAGGPSADAGGQSAGEP